jgi:hypothetical protein
MLNPMRMNRGNLLSLLVVAAACSREPIRKTGVSDTQSASPSSPSSGPRIPPDLSGRHYVGVHHDPLPAGVTHEGGAMIRIGSADYSISHVRARGVDMLWLDSIVPGKKQDPEKVVRAELRIPPLDRDERLLMASCDVDGRLDSRVVAIVVNEPAAGTMKFTKVRQAWRADVARGRFDVIPITGITCEDPGVG